MADEVTVRLLIVLQGVYEAQGAGSDRDDFYAGAVHALGTALRLLGEPPPMRQRSRPAIAAEAAMMAAERRKPRRPVMFECGGCEKQYTVESSLKSHLARHPDHRVT